MRRDWFAGWSRAKRRALTSHPRRVPAPRRHRGDVADRRCSRPHFEQGPGGDEIHEGLRSLRPRDGGDSRAEGRRHED